MALMMRLFIRLMQAPNIKGLWIIVIYTILWVNKVINAMHHKRRDNYD